MRLASGIAFVAQSATCAGAFVAISPGWSGIGAPPRVPAASRAVPAPTAAVAPPPAGIQSTTLSTAGTILAGAMVTVVALLRRDRSSKITMGVWDRLDATENMNRDDTSRGPTYRNWINLNRQARFGKGRRTRRWKVQQILKESNITSAKEGYKKWYPTRDQWNLYKGPESHPDNPWFPAASPGYGLEATDLKRKLEEQIKRKAVFGWAPAPLAASAGQSSSSGIFAGSGAPRFGHSAKHPGRGGRSAGSALVLHAHKKAASSTRNQGKSTNAHYWGPTKRAYPGNAVKAGQLLVKQKGMKFYAGANVARGRDYSLTALRDGIVQWRGGTGHNELTVVPWEYVREKCVWINPNTLGPKKYEPWMKKSGKKLDLLRKEWLETEEGKAWADKKAAKEKKQEEIQARIRAHAKLLRAGKVAAKGEPVAAGGESESEAEA